MKPNNSVPQINALWCACTAKWTEYAPDDSSIQSAIAWYEHASLANTIECIPNTRKRTQFIETLFRHRNKSTDFTKAQLNSIKRVNKCMMQQAYKLAN